MYRVTLYDPEVGAPRVWGEGSTVQKARTAARWEWRELVTRNFRWAQSRIESWRESVETI